jgi:hypothetical protein
LNVFDSGEKWIAVQLFEAFLQKIPLVYSHDCSAFIQDAVYI